jgi:2-polyprenyl-6-methoxyphenol hydroxylase-like FAD-dependent oxidoreductase
MRAVIIGAGIGGLAAAVALRRVGVETLTVERVASIREVGAGLSIWSNAMNALRELGVEARVMGAASVFERTLSRTPAGRPIAVSEFGDISRDAAAGRGAYSTSATLTSFTEPLAAHFRNPMMSAISCDV